MTGAIDHKQIEQACERIGRAFAQAVWQRRRHVHNAWMFMSIDRRLKILEQKEKRAKQAVA